MSNFPSAFPPATRARLTAWSALLAVTTITSAAVQVTVGHRDNEQAAPGFAFTNVPAPSKNDAATAATFSIVSGTADPNGGSLDTLHDGRVPDEADQPDENFFFAAGTAGGRIRVDLGRAVELKQINTYSWHPGSRGPQVYKLYASDGAASGFNASPGSDMDPEKCGWKLIAKVDTRTEEGTEGGQYGVSISETAGALGTYRELLFDIAPAEMRDGFGNTFFGEIDVVEMNVTAEPVVSTVMSPFVIKSSDGYCEITIDTAKAPDLREWAEQKLASALAEWFPRIVAALPSEGFVAPKKFSVVLRPGNGVAATSGTRITANSAWIRHELKGEAVGALVHEVVHVVQQYWNPRRNNPSGTRAPGWLVEGIPDYLRFFKYEPQSHGADLIWLQGRRNLDLKYDGMYRISANFLDYVVEHYDKDQSLIAKVNAACRQGQYTDEIWQDLTGKSLAELNDEWKGFVKSRIPSKPAAAFNVLTAAEKAAGWKLLFDGTDLAGWHNFKREGVRPGWQVEDGALVCVDPHDAGDIVSTDQFGAFELELDYNISEGGNSGIMFHVTDKGGAVWATGPEFQLEDNAKAADPIRCGWLYALYQPPNDPKTGKTLDATKPAGQWNHVRLVVTPEKCEHFINGVKYFEYVMGSDDFKARVAKSKFGTMPFFAKSDTGYLALQGDHGQVSFRNIKVHPITPTKTSPGS